jgi:hypothetical protein
MGTRGVAALPTLAILLALVACSGGSSASPSSLASAGSPSRTPAPTQSPRTLTFQLNPIGDSKAHGTVVVEVKGDGYTLAVTAEELTPNSKHLINIHAGTCTSVDLSSGEIARVAQDVQADASGKLTNLATYHNAYAIPAAGRILTLHGDEPAGNLFHIACAEMTA